MSSTADDLQRFVDAQADVFDEACAQLSAGRKTSHWMWFVFPQLRGLGRTSTAQFYGIASAAEALAYWQHPLLGPRLKRCIELLVAAPRDKSAHDILGSPDDLKLRSCLTLFQVAAPEEPTFAAGLARYYEGQPDVRTLDLLAGERPTASN
jgi:uncharacterized protein (DUF1810 family)